MSTIRIENRPDSSVIATMRPSAWNSERILGFDVVGLQADGSLVGALVILTAGRVGLSAPLTQDPITGLRVNRVLVLRDSSGAYVGHDGNCVSVSQA